MHNEFYASGFIYHPPTQQILLQQYTSKTNQPPLWTLFGGKNQQDETPVKTFHRIISEKLGLPIAEDACFSVYDYFHKDKGVTHFIHYAVTEELFDEEAVLTENKIGWFNFKQIMKLPMKPQTKQDITVGQRVINLAIRELLPPVPNPES
jgi:ADP-ribose pyrophosphatase YjhB (NUDIX family)